MGDKKPSPHFSTPPPQFSVKVEKTPSKGRVLLAQKEFQPGDEIFTVRPPACPSPSSAPPFLHLLFHVSLFHPPRSPLSRPGRPPVPLFPPPLSRPVAPPSSLLSRPAFLLFHLKIMDNVHDTRCWPRPRLPAATPLADPLRRSLIFLLISDFPHQFPFLCTLFPAHCLYFSRIRLGASRRVELS